MVTTTLMPGALRREYDNNGMPLAGGKLYTYAAGTTTPKAAFQDAAGTIPHENPITLNAKGEALVYFSGAYKLDLKTATGVQITGYPVDNFLTDPADLWDIRDDFAAPGGSDGIGFQQAGANTVSRTMQSKARDIYNVRDWDMLGGGNAGDTDAYNDAQTDINLAGGGILWVPSGEYSGLGKLYHKSSVTTHFAPGVVFESEPNVFGDNDRFYNIDGVTGGGLVGNHAIIKMNGEYGSLEQRHAVFMVDVHDFAIHDLHANDSGGDGFYCGRNGIGTHCTNVSLVNCYASGNRRQGLSVVSAVGFLAMGGLYEGTDGTSPQFGIDVEPNDSGDELDDIRFVGVTTRNNGGGGFLFALRNFVLTSDKTTSISVIGCKSIDDNQNLVSGGASLRFAGTGEVWPNTLYGSIIVQDFQSTNAQYSAIFMQDWDYQKAPHITIDGARIINPHANGSAAQPFDQCGVVAFNFSGVVTTGNFDLNNIRVSGDDCYTTFYVYDVGGPIRNWTAHDVIGEMASTSSGYLHYVSAAGPNPYTSVTFTNPPTVTVPGSMDVKNYCGQIILIGAAAQCQLPLSSDCIGQSFYFLNGGDYSATVNPDASEKLPGWSYANGDGLVMNKAGDRILLRSCSTGWVVEDISWYAQRVTGAAGYYEVVPSKLRWVSAKPVDGAHKYGDLYLNVLGQVGEPGAWKATTEGTPGDLEPLGIIGAVQIAYTADFVGATVADLKAELNAWKANIVASKHQKATP